MGVAGVVAAVAIVNAFRISPLVAVVGVIVTFVFMVVLLIFSKLTTAAPKLFTAPVMALMWAFLLLIIGTASVLFTSLFFKKPIDLSQWITPHQTESKNYEQAVRVLAAGSADDPDSFVVLFDAIFQPAGWNNLDQVLKLDRALLVRGAPLWQQTYDLATGRVDQAKLTRPGEKKAYDYVNTALLKVCTHVADVLRTPKPSSVNLDLSGTRFNSCDWSGVDLSGARIVDIGLDSVNLEGANLAGVTHFGGAYFYAVAWWEAKQISPDLLTYLEDDKNSRYQEDKTYGPSGKRVQKAEYDAALARLKH
ncbi:MAG: pentapeptide repeat-containing protein [Bryobacteraceae bacterium]